MHYSEGRFQGAGGLALYHQSWRPDGPARAALVLVHGIGEHSGRYMNIVHLLLPQGGAVYGFDHRGHGRSPGQRGYINNWVEYREDVDAFVRMVRRGEEARPMFLFGHSLGALITLEYVLRHPGGLRGAIVCGASPEPVGKTLSRGARAGALPGLAPLFTQRSSGHSSHLPRSGSRECLSGRSPGAPHGHGALGTECLAAIARVKAHATELRVPVLLLHGGADRLNAPEGTARFFDQVTYPDKTMRIYADSYHELHNDLNREEVLRDIDQWLEQRL